MTELPWGSHLDPGQKLKSCGCSLVVLTQAHKKEGSDGWGSGTRRLRSYKNYGELWPKGLV